MNAPSRQSGPQTNEEDETGGRGVHLELLGLLLQVDKRAVVLLLWLLLIGAVLYGLVVGA
jgi:hypothetical protein